MLFCCALQGDIAILGMWSPWSRRSTRDIQVRDLYQQADTGNQKEEKKTKHWSLYLRSSDGTMWSPWSRRSPRDTLGPGSLLTGGYGQSKGREKKAASAFITEKLQGQKNLTDEDIQKLWTSSTHSNLQVLGLLRID